jgi:hypothetical protein
MKTNFGSEGGKRSSYSAKEKQNVVKFALENNQAAAARKFSVHKSMVSRWVQDAKKFELADPTARRIITPSRKMTTTFMGGDEAPKRKRNRFSYCSSSDGYSTSLCLSDSSEDEESRSSDLDAHSVVTEPSTAARDDDQESNLPLPSLAYDSRSSSSVSTICDDLFEIDPETTTLKSGLPFVPFAADYTSEIAQGGTLKPQCGTLTDDAVPAGTKNFEDAILDCTHEPVVSLLKKRKTRKDKKNQLGKRQKPTKRLIIPASPIRSFFASSSDESSLNDRRGMDTLLAVPAVAAHITVSNIVDAAKYLSSCEQEELKLTFESLRLLQADTGRYRYIPCHRD